MTDVAALEKRLTTAMDRIGQAVGSYEASKGPSEEEMAQMRSLAAQATQLQQALETAKTANAQLKERIEAMKALKERQQERILQLEEVEAELKKQRAADREELDTVIAALEPLVGEAAHG